MSWGSRGCRTADFFDVSVGDELSVRHNWTFPKMSLSRVDSLLKRFPAPKHERRRLYAPAEKCAEEGCTCFLHTHFRSNSCGRHECWERIDDEIDLRLAAENRTTTLLHLVRNVGSAMSNPRAAMDMLLSANLPKPKHPRSFEIKQMDDDE